MGTLSDMEVLYRCICAASLLPLFFCALLVPLTRRCIAGTWQYTYKVTAGTATTSTVQVVINSYTMNPGEVFTLPPMPTSMSLSTNGIQPFVMSKSNTASADGVNIRCTLTWVPASGKNLTTDPPPANIDATLTLQTTQYCKLGTGTVGAKFHGLSGVSGDSINLPDLVLDLTASAEKTVSTTVKKIHRNLGTPRPRHGLVSQEGSRSAAKLHIPKPYSFSIYHSTILFRCPGTFSAKRVCAVIALKLLGVH